MRTLMMMIVGMLIPLASIGADLEAEKVKARACTACHGANGIGVSKEAEVRGPPPSAADLLFVLRT